MLHVLKIEVFILGVGGGGGDGGRGPLFLNFLDPPLQLLPEVTFGFLEKGLLPPEDSSFSLGIQLGTYIYNRR